MHQHAVLARASGSAVVHERAAWQGTVLRSVSCACCPAYVATWGRGEDGFLWFVSAGAAVTAVFVVAARPLTLVNVGIACALLGVSVLLGLLYKHGLRVVAYLWTIVVVVVTPCLVLVRSDRRETREDHASVQQRVLDRIRHNTEAAAAREPAVLSSAERASTAAAFYFESGQWAAARTTAQQALDSLAPHQAAPSDRARVERLTNALVATRNAATWANEAEALLARVPAHLAESPDSDPEGFVHSYLDSQRQLEALSQRVPRSLAARVEESLDQLDRRQNQLRRVFERVELADAIAAERTSRCGEVAPTVQTEYVRSFLGRRAHDPDSVEVVSCDDVRASPVACWFVRCRVRARNTYSALELNVLAFDVGRDGTLQGVTCPACPTGAWTGGL